ncbi:hypothetical protein L288_20275 [Sphingobium quisquiliarum P25]|uniref:TonB-dependent receptor plug domain-containing protein n=2 Tax=Sphingobium quisquiliarum TaxID=538379 RepID=T0GF48_9SPHN|nr:hypothetical protein L288_20275 [Sphingobium quisquiliarum P25]
MGEFMRRTNNRRTVFLGGSGFLLTLAAVASPAYGAEDADSSADTADAIIVTAEKLEGTVLPKREARSIYGTAGSVLDTPRSISQVGADQLIHDLIKTTDDFVKYAPGITRGGGQNISASPFIRGLKSEVYQNGQRIYFDGNDHPLNLNAYEGADIVAGPSSIVFGPGSNTGGYVNYITKKPYFDKQHTEISSQLGTWVPGGGSYADFNLTLDTSGPISKDLAYRVSIKGQRGRTYYKNVQNDYNSFFGALSWKPANNVTVDWNGSYDNYYDFNITRGWNRNTQALVDGFGTYYGGRATPIINSAGVGLWSPVFASSDPTAAPIGWQTRTNDGTGRYVAGAVQTTPLPSSTVAGAGGVQGWVYDPSIPGNGITKLDANEGSGRPDDKNTAKRYVSQLQVGVDILPQLRLLSSSYFQRSINTNDSVGSFIYQNRSTLFDQRLELQGKFDGDLFGLPISLQSNTGGAIRLLKYRALSANNNFNFDPYDLTLDPSTQTPSALYGLPLANPNASGSWVGVPGVPQQTRYFGYLNLPVMVPVDGGFYSEIGGFPTSGGAVYTSNGHVNQWSLFTQQNVTFADTVGVNLGVNVTQISAYINNPVYLTAAQQHSDRGRFTLPSYQASVYVKPSANSTIYATYDRSTALNTGVFGNFLTWGPGNKLNPLAFKSVSELYEGGVKWEPAPGKLFLSATGFIQYRDLSPDQNGNIARIRIKGVEGSARFQPTNNLSAGVNGTYLNAVNSYVSPFGFSLYGFFADNATPFGDQGRLRAFPAGRYPLAGIPKYSLNGFVDYHLDNGLGAEVSAWWTSSWNTDLSRTVRVPNEYNVNLTLYYRQPKYDLALRLLNITDQKNFLNALTGAGFLQPLAPFSVQGQFAIRF